MTRNKNIVGQLKPGDVVEVRTAAEIMATLDPNGSFDGMPFMPEMAPFAGKRFTVYKRVEKICDTIHITGSRRMRDTVFLENLRCDGSSHGGCQAECRIYWKEAWLSKVDPEEPQSRRDDAGADDLVAATRPQVFADASSEPEAILYRCQATEAFRATEPIESVVSPGQYVREISCGNVSLGRFIQVAARALSWKVGARLGLGVGSKQPAPYSEAVPTDQDEKKAGPLQDGEWVQVRSPEEIGATLNLDGTNKGLRFSPTEMLPACGQRFQVRRRVEKLIDERTGRMLNVKNDCIALEGFVCTGERSPGRWFCGRELYPYWREAWLKRVDGPQPPQPEQGEVSPREAAPFEGEAT